MLLFKGNDKFAYRDPTCYLYGDTYCLFFTVSEKDDGYMYNRTAMSRSKDLVRWSEPVFLTPRDLSVNYCSPGNIIKKGDEYIMCLTSYPMPFRYSVRDHADESARVFIMRTKDFEIFTQPEMLIPKRDTRPEELGRMIDPYILEKENKYYLFFKQNGVSLSVSEDLETWDYLGNTEGGENACVIKHDGKYLLIHSPEHGIGFKESDDLENWVDLGITTMGFELERPRCRLTAGFAANSGEGCRYRYLMFYHISENQEPETHGNAGLYLSFTDDFEKFYHEM